MKPIGNHSEHPYKDGKILLCNNRQLRVNYGKDDNGKRCSSVYLTIYIYSTQFRTSTTHPFLAKHCGE
jgi:hypothetical protein